MSHRAPSVRRAVHTNLAPPPAGTYSQAVTWGGLVFLAGQTPRRPDGTRVGDLPFEAQVSRALDNLAAVAAEAGASLDNALKVTVYLQEPRRAAEFDMVYREYVGAPPPARTCIGADLPEFDVEVDAIVALG